MAGSRNSIHQPQPDSLDSDLRSRVPQRGGCQFVIGYSRSEADAQGHSSGFTLRVCSAQNAGAYPGERVPNGRKFEPA